MEYDVTVHELSTEYLSKTFDFSKSPEEFAKEYLNVSAEISNVLNEVKSKAAEGTMKAYLHL